MHKLYKRVEAIKEIEREQGQRKKVYPRLIDRKTLRSDTANHQYLKLDCIQVVLQGMTNEQFRHFYVEGLRKIEAPKQTQKTMDFPDDNKEEE